MNNIYLQILARSTEANDLVLATVTGKNGSAPQEPGSSAIFDEKGLVAGTIGGGIVEGRIQKIATESAHTGIAGHFQFNLSNDISNTEDAICGGQISILADAGVKKSIPVFEKLKKSLAAKIPGVLITMVTLPAGKSLSIDRYWMTEGDEVKIPGGFMDEIKPVVLSLLAKRVRTEYTKMEFAIPGEMTSTLFLLEPVFPQPRLVIAGAGHIGRSLAHIGYLLDFEVTVIDDRPEYANSENIPDAAHVIVRNIGEAMQELAEGKDTYVVIVTRGHKDDAAALKSCIGAGAAYVGMIGSRNKIAAMKRDFLDKGWATPGQWDKIHAPVGLDIKSQTVEEIAVSIAAQLVLVRNNKKDNIVI